MDFVTSNFNYLWIGLALITGAMLLFPALAGAGANVLSPLQAVMLVNRQNALMLDIRSAAEFEVEFIAGSRNIPLPELESRIEELAKYRQKPLIVLCATGGARAAQAVKALSKAGFEQIFSLSGGLNAWKDAGQPVSTKKSS